MFAPGNFLKQLERAITADDYATLAERHPKVQRAAAVLKWTGTRYEARVAIDPLGTDEMQPLLLDDVRKYLYRYRRIGHDLTVAQATYVPLALEISIGVLPDYLSAHVKSALLDVFSNRILNTGAKGFFHPDSFSFGDAVYLSRLVAAAQAVTGVESVVVTRLERMFEGPNSELENGLLPIGPLEVARLDNDSRFPENGTLILSLRGGR
jgi:predicted phage baseplate assembly protein